MNFHSQKPTNGGAARQHTLREQNLALVAHAVMSSPEPVSRAEVAVRTGLTRATVSTLVDRLILGGILAELPPVTTGGAGRPAVPLVPARRSVAGLGLVVNINYIAAALVDLSGEVIAEAVRQGDYRASDPAEVLAELREMTGRLLEHEEAASLRIAGAFVAVPGLVEPDSGVVTIAPNLNWSQVPVIELLDLDSIVGERKAGISPFRVRVANDAKLAALAEVNSGTSDTFIYVSAEQGIGGAVVVHGELFRGQHGWSGEIGHVIVDPAGPPCGCGASGCLEVYAGRNGLMAAAGLPASSTMGMLVARIEDGDERALVALKQASRSLGAVLSDLVNVFDISTVIIRGELIPLVPHLAEDLTAQLNHRVLSAPYVAPTVEASRMGTYPALLGAAREALRGVITDPALWV
jgi:predicted NBD/HSP70 family sugar kinase